MLLWGIAGSVESVDHVREMIGLDREATKRAFDGFLAGKTLTANQIQFVNLVIDYLTQSG